MTFTVLVTDYAWPSLDIERDLLAAVDAELVVAQTGEVDELIELAASADAILTNWAKVPEAALDAAPKCLVVSRYGVGVDNIPVEHATELGILVANVPDFCLDEVSDHTMALLLACARRVVPLALMTGKGAWSTSSAEGMPRLRGQTLGLIGFGNIARLVATKAAVFGLRILAYTPRISAGFEGGVELTADLNRILLESDYVSLHAPATTETRGLIGRHELRRMKCSAFLINTSRGALVDETALVRAVEDQWIAGAAIDVLTDEPPRPDNPLLGLDNILVTPHVAFYSTEAIAELECKAATNVATVLQGSVPPTIVNPSALERRRGIP